MQQEPESDTESGQLLERQRARMLRLLCLHVWKAASFRGLAPGLPFSRGGSLRLGAAERLREPAVGIRGLAVGIVPWTLALALAPARFFPAPWVRWGWVAVDAGFFLGLSRLARRWDRGLGTLLAAAATADLAITCIQAITWNLPRAKRPVDAWATGAAVLAPGLATLLLWRARWHRRCD